MSDAQEFVCGVQQSAVVLLFLTVGSMQPPQVEVRTLHPAANEAHATQRP